MDAIFKTTSATIDAVNSGSLFDSTELDTIKAVLSDDASHGTLPTDELEFFIYDIDGNLSASGLFPKTDVWNITPINYTDNFGVKQSYAVRKYQNANRITYKNTQYLRCIESIQSVVPDAVKNVVLVVNFGRALAGSRKNSLKIKEISPSRKELKLRFDQTKLGSQEYLDFRGYVDRNINITEISENFLGKLGKYNVYQISNDVYQDSSFEYVRNRIGVKTNSNVIDFINGMYYGMVVAAAGVNPPLSHMGIYDDIRHYLNKNQATWISPEILLGNILTTVQSNIKHRLIISKIDDSDETLLKFFNTWIVDNFIVPSFNAQVSEYNTKYSYLTSGLNFGSNAIYPILNSTGQDDEIIVKLSGYLPVDKTIGDVCWISDITRPSLIQKVIIDAPIVKRSKKISGPDFSRGTITPDNRQFKSASDLSPTTDDARQISFYQKLSALNVDYSTFENFIVFSSAELRIKLFLNKLLKLRSYSTIKTNLANTSSHSSLSVSQSYATEYQSISDLESSVFDSFDGFDTYLYHQDYIASGSVSGNEDLNSYISESIAYDKSNGDSLVNNTPSYITTNSDNDEYVIFLSMIGHHFDNLYLYINNFPPLQNTQLYTTGSTYVSTMADTLLESFGWSPIASYVNDGETAFLTSSYNSVEGETKSKIIWNRILQNLPAIYKSKGTEDCIRMISNIYGVPYHLLTVKTLGGNYATQQSSSYTIEDRLYLTKFKRGSEYIELPYDSDTGAIEFKVKFDDVSYENDVPFRIVETSNWNLEVIKSKSTSYGRCQFNITGSATSHSIVSSDVPIFNGDIVNIMVKRENPSGASFDTSSMLPYYYTLLVAGYDGSRQKYFDRQSELLSHDYSAAFTASGVIQFGNKTSNGLYGNLDKINIWSGSVSDTLYHDHSKNCHLYSYDTASLTRQHLKFRYAFDYPVDLRAIGSIQNKNGFYSTTASIVNFTYNTTSIIDCVEWSASVFPYQFDEIDVIQDTNLQGYGPTAFKNTQINSVNETVLSRFTADSYSTTREVKSDGSNLIGVYVSPVKVRNEDIIRLFGDYDVMQDIASPAFLYSGSYDSLARLREIYNTNNLGEKILFNEFLTLYRQYLDTSLFDTIERVIPSRNKLVSGIVIEPTVLERSKYHYRHIVASNSVPLSSSVSGYVNPIQAILIPSYTSSIPTITRDSIQQRDRFGGDFISADRAIERNSCFSIHGNYTDMTGAGPVSRSIYRMDTRDSISGHGGLSTYSKSYVDYNFATCGTVMPGAYTLDTTSYPKEHLSLKRNGNRRNTVIQITDNSVAAVVFKKSSQTSKTTVNSNGIQDGSAPVEITHVPRETTQNALF
jgi:hypothetical protein